MTNEEAIRDLKKLRSFHNGSYASALDKAIKSLEMDEDAKQASIPYTYDAPQHDWTCGYPTITKEDYKRLLPRYNKKKHRWEPNND